MAIDISFRSRLSWSVVSALLSTLRKTRLAGRRVVLSEHDFESAVPVYQSGSKYWPQTKHPRGVSGLFNVFNDASFTCARYFQVLAKLCEPDCRKADETIGIHRPFAPQYAVY